MNNTLKTLNKCIECGKCEKSCLLLKKYIKSPKDLLKHEDIKDSVIFSCTLCNHCVEVCPNDVDLKSVFLSLKKQRLNKSLITKKNIKYPQINLYQSACFSNFLTSFNNKNGSVKKVFFPGCSLSSHSKSIVYNIYKYLNKYEEIGLQVDCCGNPCYSIGDNKFKKRFKKMSDKLKKASIEEIIVACPNCYKTFKKNLDIKVTSLWEKIIEYGIDSLKPFNPLEMSILHDSCAIRSFPIFYDSVRKVLDLCEINYKEFDKNKNLTKCCGSGGMLKMINPNLSKEINDRRKASNKNLPILCYCQECSVALGDSNTETYHILEILFNQKIKKNKNSFILWKERYDLVKLTNDIS